MCTVTHNSAQTQLEDTPMKLGVVYCVVDLRGIIYQTIHTDCINNAEIRHS